MGSVGCGEESVQFIVQDVAQYCIRQYGNEWMNRGEEIEK